MPVEYLRKSRLGYQFLNFLSIPHPIRRANLYVICSDAYTNNKAQPEDSIYISSSSALWVAGREYVRDLLVASDNFAQTKRPYHG